MFYDYEDFFRGQHSSLFKNIAASHFDGIRNGSLYIAGRRFQLNHVKVFPGEGVENDDLGPSAMLYQRDQYACVEGIAASASGTAVRHMSVYLIEMRSGSTEVYKLPSLFASCLSVHLDPQRRLAFFEASLVHDVSDSDEPTGSELRKFAIDTKGFIPTGRTVLTRFPERGNVWRFAVESGD